SHCRREERRKAASVGDRWNHGCDNFVEGDWGHASGKRGAAAAGCPKPCRRVSRGRLMATTSEVNTMDNFLKGLWRENPVFVMLLGTCPTLAVTNSVMNALAMGLAASFVLVMSNLLVSMLRNYIPKQVRIATYIVIIATFVTIVDYMIQMI